jgi:hypothetical protein
MKQIPGKIYLSEGRGLFQTGQICRYSTFNFEGFFDQHKGAFGDLYVFNEETLAGGQTITQAVAEASYVILLPITGEVHFIDDQDNVLEVDVEEVLIHQLPADHSFRIANPYASDAITFLQIRIKAEQPAASAQSHLYRYSLGAIAGRLTDVVPIKSSMEANTAFPFWVSLGQFAGRAEATYPLKDKSSSCFAFVMRGAFELEGRLLHQGDGLALWETEEVELEALSENALILLLELRRHPPH